MNIVLIVVDSLRQDHVGAYGNKWIHTPNLDSFATQSVVYDRCYPESLPTLQVRKALHTLTRTFPYPDFNPDQEVLSGQPGWGPIVPGCQTVAESLRKQGYRCCLISDCYHLFKPRHDFHRGFHEWQWVRGQEFDAYRSGPRIGDDAVSKHLNDKGKSFKGLHEFIRVYKQNNAERTHDAQYSCAQVFQEGVRWIEQNQDAKDFFLVIDSFDPHEPWMPPKKYRRLYDPDEEGLADMAQSPYWDWKEVMSPRELKRIQANYAGCVTQVDNWIGYFLNALKMSGRQDDTLVGIISDHGHNLGHDPQDRGIVGKQGHPMTRAVADLVAMIRHPKGEGAGEKCSKLCWDLDFPHTLIDMAGAKTLERSQGVDIWSDRNDAAKKFRDYVTIYYGPAVSLIKDNWWYNADIWGDGQLLYDTKADPLLLKNVAAENPDTVAGLKAIIDQETGPAVKERLSLYKGLQWHGTGLFKFSTTPYGTTTDPSEY